MALEMSAELPLGRLAGVSAAPWNDADTLRWTRSLSAGDEAAWSAFHAAYASRLLRYLLVLTRGDEAAARDALQQAFVRAVRHMRLFKTEPDLWRWLVCLARSAAADQSRRERRQMSLLARWFHEQPDPSLEVEPDAALAVWESAVDAAMAALSSEEREVIEAKYLEGMTVVAIAARYQTTEKAIESRLARARSRLRSRVLALLKHTHESHSPS